MRVPPWRRSSRAPTTRCRTPRACWPRTWCAVAIRRSSPSRCKQLIERKRERDFPWFPARVVCHDILGQTALVDLAGLRDAIAERGGDPAKVNPVVPVQLIVDHSLAVECGGFDPNAFAKNRAIEDRRNEDRFHFIEWTKRAFENVDVIPPGNGIMHQINLEKMSPVIQVQDGVCASPIPAWAPTAIPRTWTRWASSPSAWAGWRPRA